jgi:hypothetical protein
VLANGFGLAESLRISELELAGWKRNEGGGSVAMLPSAIPTYRRGLEIKQAFYVNYKFCGIILFTEWVASYSKSTGKWTIVNVA